MTASDSNSGKRKPAPGQGTCPICGAAASATHRPFCSRRCADLDLGRWLKGHYRIPTEEVPADGIPDAEDDERF